ncbi:hypothetical protein [Pseudomonas koreensis]|uniref:AI-2E family transporter n=1 Tax=Pseudomonas koreensis TaxID=198620 RepID=UPI002FC737F3
MLIRAGLITVLVLFCYDIFHPFLNVMLWALILAVTLYPLNQKLGAKLGNRYGWAAIILVLLGLAILMLPLSLLGASIADSVKGGMRTIEAGQFEIPPPPASVEAWPLIGAPLYGIWMHASQDLSWTFQELAPHLKDWSRVVLHQAAGVGAGIVVFVIALIVAGLIGALGGMVTSGIIGLFTGPVILAVGYELFIGWVYQPANVTDVLEDPGNEISRDI